MPVSPTLLVLVLAAGTLAVGALAACGRGEAPREPAPVIETASPDPAKPDPDVQAPPKGTPKDWPSIESRRLQDGFAPTPFTADQIRWGCPSGLRSIYAMGGDGATTYQHFAFDNSDGMGTDFSVTVTPARDTPIETRATNRLEWSGLQGHANFPERATAIENETITVEAGTFACMRYTVTSVDDGKTAVGTFWFAYDLPGAPIKWIRKVDDVVIRSMELIHREIVE